MQQHAPEADEEWVDVDAGKRGTVRTRIIRPKDAKGPLPVVFYIHGAGGWVFGDDKTHDRLFRELAVGAGVAGVFPVHDWTIPPSGKQHHASPLQSSPDQLKGLPTTLVITDEADVLRDEGEMYADKLREAGVDVTSVRAAGMVHDFLLLDSLRDTRAANVARKLAVDAMRTAPHDS